MAPVLCMITDRRRLPQPSDDALVEAIAAAAAAGVDLVHLRERDLEGRALLRLARRAVACVRGTTTRVLINDRVDVALAAGAHGVHLRGDSLPARRVRAWLPRGAIVGRSVHSVEEADQAWREGGTDLLVFGHVYATSSKPGIAPAGCDRLRQVVLATPLPVLAIGGVTAARFGEVAAAGAAGVAAIGLFAAVPVAAMQATLDEARRAFDTH